MTNQAHSPSSVAGYRRDIDGLRAIAVVLVVIFHFFPSILPAGFFGVDVFFVISGYLISKIILTAALAGCFSYLDFYKRRALRIFPGLSIVLLFTYVVGWVLLLPIDFASLGKQIAGGAGFVSNLVLLQESGYFDASAVTKPLLHLWSLGVEEQFYFIFPILILGAVRFGFSTRRSIVTLATLSFLLNLGLIKHHPAADFYLPMTRFWELLLGAFLADLHVRAGIAKGPGAFPGLSSSAHSILRALPSPYLTVVKHGGSVVGLLLLALPPIFLSEQISFPGWWALLPTLGATVLISVGDQAMVNRHLLSSRPFVWIGLVSYPLYLWHWVLFSFTFLRVNAEPSTNIRLVLLAVSLLLAWLTFLIERPIRYGKHGAWIAIALCSVMVALCGAGLFTTAANGIPQRYGTGAQQFLTPIDFKWKEGVRMGTCHIQKPESTKHDPDCIESHRPLLLLWGDSHAASLYPGLKKLQGRLNFGIAQLTQAGCPPVFDIANPVYKKDCNQINREVFETAIRLQPETLILDAAWFHDDYPMTKGELRKKLGQTLLEIKKGLPKTRVIVMGPAPRWTIFLQNVMYNYWAARRREPVPEYLQFGLDLPIFGQNLWVQKIALENHTEFISVTDILCRNGACLTRTGPSPLDLTSADRWHLSRAGAEYVIEQVASQLFPQGK